VAVTGTGLTTAYNRVYGTYFDSSLVGGTLMFDNDSAFLSNDAPGIKNASTVTVSATNNQWRDPASDIEGPGPVTYLPVKDPASDPIVLSASQPTFPSNVLLKGQTIRVQGTGFNAVAGNPLGSDPNANCSTGYDDLSTSCCRTPGKANVCGQGVHDPIADRGNCVELKTAGGTWVPTSVTSVTPTTIVTEIPDQVFGCVGDAAGSDGEVSVSKLRDDGTPDSKQKPYCTNLQTL
jgi:hypothetical protein